VPRNPTGTRPPACVSWSRTGVVGEVLFPNPLRVLSPPLRCVPAQRRREEYDRRWPELKVPQSLVSPPSAPKRPVRGPASRISSSTTSGRRRRDQWESVEQVDWGASCRRCCPDVGCRRSTTAANEPIYGAACGPISGVPITNTAALRPANLMISDAVGWAVTLTEVPSFAARGCGTHLRRCFRAPSHPAVRDDRAVFIGWVGPTARSGDGSTGSARRTAPSSRSSAATRSQRCRWGRRAITVNAWLVPWPSFKAAYRGGRYGPRLRSGTDPCGAIDLPAQRGSLPPLHHPRAAAHHVVRPTCRSRSAGQIFG